MRYICFNLNFQECIANYLNCLVYVDIFMNISNNHVTWLKKSTKTERRDDAETTQTHSRRGHTRTAGARLVAAWASYYWMWCRGRRRRRGALRRPHTNLWHLRLRRRRLHTQTTTTQRTLTRRPFHIDTIISEMVTALLFQFIKCNLRNHQLYIRKYHFLMFSC